MSSFVTHTLIILAQNSTTAAPTTGPTPPGWQQMLANPMFGIFLVFAVLMLVMSGSKRKQEKQRKQTLEAIKRGDRVQTIGGIIGTIVDVRDKDVVVKVDEGNNTKIKFTRSAIAHVMTDEDKTAEK